MHRRLRREVVGIAALAADQRIVLLAQYALTDAEFDGSSHLVSVSRSDIGFHVPILAILQCGCRKRKRPFDSP